MKVETKKLPDSKVELQVEVSAEELNPFLDEAAKEISNNLNVPGFRAGHVPRPIVEKEIGTFKLWEEAARKATVRTYVKAIVDNKIDAIGQPDLKVEKIAPDNPLVYKATVTCLPKIALPDYKKIGVKRKKIEIEKEKIDEMIGNLQKSRAKTKEVEREAKKGDAVEVDFKTYLDKVPVEHGESKNHQLVISEGQFVPGFEEKLIGMKAGDKKEFKIRFPKEYHQKNMADRDVDFKVEIKKVSERELPELNDEFAVSCGKFKNVKELKQRLEENLITEAGEKEKTRLETEMVDKIAEKTELEIPKMLVNGEVEKMLSELKNMVASSGGEYGKYLESIKKTEEELKKDFQKRAEKRVKFGLILREIAKAEKIEATDDELKEEKEKTMAKYQHDEKVMKQIQSFQYEDYMRNLIQNRKVFEFLNKTMVK